MTMSKAFTYTLKRSCFDENYNPSENTRTTTNFANLARGEKRQENLRNTLVMINNRFNGTVTLGIVTINSANDALSYTDGNVRSDSCPTLVNQLSDEADRITVAGTIVKPLNGVVNAAALKTQCDSANNLAIMFERMKRA